MKKIILILAMLMMLPAVFAASVSRSMPATITAGSTFQVTYTASGYGSSDIMAWTDNANGGCTPISKNEYLVGPGSKQVTFTAPQSGSCTFSGTWSVTNGAKDQPITGDSSITIEVESVCNNNADCGSVSYNYYCDNNDYITETVTPTCFNAGQQTSYCQDVPVNSTETCNNICSVIQGCDYTECSDGDDNDGDSTIDYPNDLGCGSYEDDNEGDGVVACSSNSDCGQDSTTSICNGLEYETTTVTYTCLLPGTEQSSCTSDTGVSSSTCNNICSNSQGCDYTECSDGIDNDGDGLVDMADPYCTDLYDNGEVDIATSEGTATIGDSNTDASNVDEDILKTGTTSFNVIPSETGTLSCTVSPESKYQNTLSPVVNNINITFGGNSVGTYSVTAGEGTNVVIRGRIPENLDAVNSNFQETSFKVATISCNIGGYTHTQEVKMQRMHMFEIDKIYASYDGESESIDDNDEIKDLKPGTSIDLEVQMENNFDDDEDTEMDVEVEIECDSDIDVDDESDDTTIDADDEDSVSFDLDLDEDDVEDKTYKCKVTAIATDDFGALHGMEWSFDLEIEKEKYMIEIKEFTLDPVTLSCSNYDATAEIRIKNIGSKDDDEVSLELKSDPLGLFETLDELDLEENDETKRTFMFSIANDVVPGVYDIIATTYSKGVTLSDQEIKQLTVPNCEPEPVVQQQPQVTQKPKTTTQPQLEPQVKVQKTKSKPKKERLFAGFYRYGDKLCWFNWCW